MQNVAADGLILELRKALVHLDDPPRLETLSLAKRVTPGIDVDGLSRGQALSRVLRLAIAALDPGITSRPSGSLQARSYQVLYRYAIGGKSMTAIALSLGISKRQGYRDLECAIEALAAIVADSLIEPVVDDTAGGDGSADKRAPIREEINRLALADTQEVDLDHLLQEVVQSAQYLARSQGVEMRLELEPAGLRIATNRVMLKQGLLNLLSHILSRHPESEIDVRLGRSEEHAIVEFVYRWIACDGELSVQDPYAIALSLFRSLGLKWLLRRSNSSETEFRLLIPIVTEKSVLLIDDNEGLIALFRRYLHQQHYVVYSASTVEKALEILDMLVPDVVILDIMMPDRDGWEVLQTLRESTARCKVRVIICSVIDDPQLASALGADAFLNKPVDRGLLLQTLNSVLKTG